MSVIFQWQHWLKKYCRLWAVKSHPTSSWWTHSVVQHCHVLCCFCEFCCFSNAVAIWLTGRDCGIAKILKPICSSMNKKAAPNEGRPLVN